MMAVIPETNLLTTGTLKVKRLVSRITIIKYDQSQKIGFCNNHHQVRSKSKDWFL
jgi:hypothetical protein